MSALRNIPRRNWPVLIESIAQVMGDEAAMKLFIRFNGRSLTPPVKVNADHVIAQTIGVEKAEQFCSHFAGEALLIPKGAYLLRKIRNQNIVEDWLAGMSQQDIATKYDLCTRQINDIIKQHKAQSNHG